MAREYLIARYSPLIARSMRPLKGTLPGGLTREDVEQELTLELIRLVDAARTSVDEEFWRFAAARLAGAALDLMRKYLPGGRWPEERRKRIERGEALASASKAGAIDDLDRARELGVDLDGYYALRDAAFVPSCVSIESGREGEEGSTFAVAAALHDPGDGPEGMAIRQAAWRELQKAVSGLPPEQARIVRLLYLSQWPASKLAAWARRDVAEINEMAGRAVKRLGELLEKSRDLLET